MLYLRFAASATIFISSRQATTFKPDISVMASAIQYCAEAGLSRQLSKELKSADIFRQYELFVRSQPWKRHPATLILKKIYKFLAVFFFFVCLLYIVLNNHAFRRVDIPASMNLTLT